MGKINWFPGHMAKTTNDLKEQAKSVDMVIEVVDSRAVKTSSNEELTNIFANKPKLTVALKSDLADVRHLRETENFIFGSTKNKPFRNKIIEKIYYVLDEKIRKMKKKGLARPQLYIIVVGLPNIGKSSLINFLANKKIANVENRPGVTKARQIIKINENLFLYDTPGVLFKKIEEETDGFKLGLINCIKKEVLPLSEVNEFAYNYFINKYKKETIAFYKLHEENNFDSFMGHICKTYGFKSHENKNDLIRANDFLFTNWVNAKVCKVSYDN